VARLGSRHYAWRTTFLKEMTATYIGFDPTSDSLYREFSAYNSFSTFKNFGHKPIAVGGAQDDW
jgi:tyrosyl-tRNA synthetase